MNITVKCYATLARFKPENAEQYPISEGTTARDVLEALSIPEDELKLVFINGLHSKLDAELHDGDRLGFLPAVGGG